MDLNTKYLAFTTLLFAMAMMGCSDSTSGKVSTVGGYIILIDERGAYVQDRSGVVVRFSGASASATTRSSGYWELGVPNGIHEVTFEKEGYPVQHLGLHSNQRSFQLDSYEMYQIPAFTITLDGITMPKPDTTDEFGQQLHRDGIIYAHTSTNTPGLVTIYASVIISPIPEIDVTNITTFASISLWGSNRSYNDSSIDIVAALDYKTVSGFKSGEAIYFRAYPYFGLSQQHDISLGRSYNEGYGNSSNIIVMTM